MARCPQSFPQVPWKNVSKELRRKNWPALLFFFAAAFIPLRHHFVSATEHWAGARAVGLADQPFPLHDVENCGGTAVTDAQSSLQHRSRSSLHFNANAQSLFEKLIVLAASVFQAQRLFFRLRNRF